LAWQETHVECRFGGKGRRRLGFEVAIHCDEVATVQLAWKGAQCTQMSRR
jgi:hypothetical protein